MIREDPHLEPVLPSVRDDMAGALGDQPFIRGDGDVTYAKVNPIRAVICSVLRFLQPRKSNTFPPTFQGGEPILSAERLP